MFRRRDAVPSEKGATRPEPVLRVSSVLGPEVVFRGRLSGRGGVRIEGAFEGEVSLDGLLVIGETGRVTCEDVRARRVVVAGLLKGNITAEKVEIRRTGRVWGDVRTVAFATEEGAFLRGKVQMEEKLDLAFRAEHEEEATSQAGEEEPPSDEAAEDAPSA